MGLKDMSIQAEPLLSNKLPTNAGDSAMADILMDEISAFVEETTEAEILEESREIR